MVILMPNKKLKGILVGGFLIVFALSSSGCEERHEAPAQGATSGRVEAAAVDAPQEEKRQAGRFFVALFPPDPKVGDALQAVLSGKSSEAAIRWMRNGEIIKGQTAEVLPAHSFVKGDTVTVMVDSDAGQAEASATIVNSPPQVASVPFANPFITCGADIVAEPQGIDEDGDPVHFTFLWSINGEEVIGNDSPLLSGEHFCKGDRIALDVVPYDEDGAGQIFRGREFVVPNSPPSFISAPPLQFNDRIYSYEARAEDPDGDRLTYSLESAPVGMTIDNATGDIRWLIEAGAAGEHHIRIVVQDEEGMNAFQEFMLSLEIAAREEN